MNRLVADFTGYLQAGQARHMNILLHGDQAREGHVHGFDHILQLLLSIHAVAADGELGNPRGMGDAQMLGDGRANLSGIAVGGLLAAEDEIKVANALDGLRKGVAGGEHVRAAQTAVREHIALVRAHHIGFLHHGLRLRRAHGADRHGAAVLSLEAQERFPARYRS